MKRDAETVIIGAGQAGLALSYCLSELGHEHVVLERGEVGDSWRRQRWDSFHLVTSNWQIQLPGSPYRGQHPHGFLPRDAVVAYLADYAVQSRAPVISGVRATALAPLASLGSNRAAGRGPHNRPRFRIGTTRGPFRAHNLVVATGPFQTPTVPRYASAIAANYRQLHPFVYRNPENLPSGAVLVVGTGQSGCQIAEELLDAGRRVYLATSRCGRVPRRYRGRDICQWLDALGVYDQDVDSLPSAQERYGCNPHLSGSRGGHTIHLGKLAQNGARLLGRVEGAREHLVFFADDLEHNLGFADAFAARTCRRIDDYISANDLDAPADAPASTHGHGSDYVANASTAPSAEQAPVRRLDLRQAGVSAIIWATGYRCQFDWVSLPVLDERGMPIHQRGVTAWPGLYFLGLPWLHRRKSALLYGIGEDAAYLASQIVGSMHDTKPPYPSIVTPTLD